MGPCMAEGFTRAQRIEGYKLLILTYLFDDDQFEAEKTMMEFLKKFPEYEIMPNDPVEFVYLFETYRTTSVFSVGLSAGFNLTNPRILEPYSAYDHRVTDYKNTTGTGYQIGIGVGRSLGKRIMLNLELRLAQNRYSFTESKTIDNNEGKEYTKSSTLEEKLQKVEFPLTAILEFGTGNLKYLIRAGASVDYVLKSFGTPSRNYDGLYTRGEKTDLSEFRKSFHFNGIVGAGIRYKVPRGYLLADMRFCPGLHNIVIAKKRYDNPYLEGAFDYVDDDFALNSFQFSLGYYFSFYSPKKQH